MGCKRNRLNFIDLLVAMLLAFCATSTIAAGLLESSEDEFLPVDEAFQLTAVADSAEEITLFWTIADGYYLYRDRITVKSIDSTTPLGEIQLPRGKEKHDEFFGDVEILEYSATAQIPLSAASDAANFEVSYQGCAHAGLCYPPVKKSFSLDLPGSGATITSAAGTDGGSPSLAAVNQSEQGQIAANIGQQKIGQTVWWFFIAGLLLAFTPCVFPMIPILSSIIAGQGEELSATRGFSLSLVYVLAMAVTYTLAGVIVGLTGANLQIWFQNPVVIISFALIFVLLSLSMFGLYELQMPAAIQSKLTSMSGSQKQGSFAGTAIMGFLSALIVGPCVTAPLIGALIYIAESGNPWVGGLALFSLSMGMGMPLLLAGTSAGRYLPRAGAWMEPIKAVFGVMLLALAIWFLDRIAPRPLILALSGALLIGCGTYLGAFIRTVETANGWLRLRQAFAWVALVYGSILLVGASAGSKSLLMPLSNFYAQAPTGQKSQSQRLAFQPIKGIAGLESALQQARQLNKPVLVDMYADWCISCKELEAYTFTDSKVQLALGDFILLKADVTDNDEQDQQLLKQFGLFGPPALLFFDPNGQEQRSFRVVGFIKAANFERHIGRFSDSSLIAANRG